MWTTHGVILADTPWRLDIVQRAQILTAGAHVLQSMKQLL